MSDRTSESIVSFIASLLPLYVGEERDGMTCARSLEDGTLIIPMGGEFEQGYVKIHWDGDASRSFTVQGKFLASLAVARYVELHSIAHNKGTKFELEYLSNHFTVKTGESLIFSFDSNSELYKWVGKAVEKVGAQAAIEVLKKATGF